MAAPLHFCMKLFEKIGHKMAGGATEKVKKEVKKTALDIMPTIVSFASMVLGFVIFRGVAKGETEVRHTPSVTNTSITTNNYFFQEMSDESIRKILEDD